MSKSKKAQPKSNSTTVTITKDNVIDEPDGLLAGPNGAVQWIVVNNDTISHSVSIDPKKIKNKKNKKYDNPFKGSSRLVTKPKTLPPGAKGSMGALIRDTFSSPEECFKYSIVSDGTTLDPDLDVVDPNPIIPEKR